jgi:hypothetical protein
MTNKKNKTRKKVKTRNLQKNIKAIIGDHVTEAGFDNIPITEKSLWRNDQFGKRKVVDIENFIIRNHIDNYSSVYNRGYNEVDSVPTNLMPMLADNLGWELITPFTGSLSTMFGSSASPTTTTDDIKHNTWRKSLNNLIYLYNLRILLEK